MYCSNHTCALQHFNAMAVKVRTGDTKEHPHVGSFKLRFVTVATCDRTSHKLSQVLMSLCVREGH